MHRNIDSHKENHSGTIEKRLFDTRTSYGKSSSSHRSEIALRVFFNIMNAWQLSSEQQIKILGIPRSTFFKWKKRCHGDLSQDTLERISYVFGIYKALQILLPDPKAADEWISKPNNAPLFNGHSALNRMLSGQVADLYIVRQYLDSERGGWA